MTTARTIGFTGTRHGMTVDQYTTVRRLMGEFAPVIEAHHGDCVGADAEFALICTNLMLLSCATHAHPPSNPSLRAWTAADVVHDPKPYLERDADIVAASDVLIACPFERTEQQRSGTWATVRMARRAGKPLVIVYPQGHVTRERWEGLTP